MTSRCLCQTQNIGSLALIEEYAIGPSSPSEQSVAMLLCPLLWYLSSKFSENVSKSDCLSILSRTAVYRLAKPFDASLVRRQSSILLPMSLDEYHPLLYPAPSEWRCQSVLRLVIGFISKANLSPSYLKNKSIGSVEDMKYC